MGSPATRAHATAGANLLLLLQALAQSPPPTWWWPSAANSDGWKTHRKTCGERSRRRATSTRTGRREGSQPAAAAARELLAVDGASIVAESIALSLKRQRGINTRTTPAADPCARLHVAQQSGASQPRCQAGKGARVRDFSRQQQNMCRRPPVHARNTFSPAELPAVCSYG